MNDFKKDLYRWYGNSRSLKDKIFCPKEVRYLYWFRKAGDCKIMPLKLFYKFMIRRNSAKTHIQIPPGTQIGGGLYIGHCGRIIINPRAILGANTNIATGVVIGQENRGKRKGTPTIGDCCWIGANAVIVGNITIGSNVLIAPLSYVNFDVPDNSVVIGNPARIIPKENATEGYINRTV